MKATNLSDARIEAGDRRTKTTGRYVIVLRKDRFEEGIAYLKAQGFEVFISKTADSPLPVGDAFNKATAIGLRRIRVVVVEGSPDQISQLIDHAGKEGPIQFVEPEKIRRLLPASFPAVESGNKFDSISTFLDTPTVAPFDETASTWGLQATGVVESKYSGAGVRIAILDTGIAFETDANGDVRYHPDFEGRTIFTKPFVEGLQTAQDGNGHGTHCIGTACGPRQPAILPRYGIASEAEIYAGKIVNDAGEGVDLWAMAGIEWAIAKGCQIVSMSIGGDPKKKGDPFNQAYEEIAQSALDAGTIIVAAAGNDSSRPDPPLAVVGPADCPSVIAVTAVNSQFQLWREANGGINPSGGEINFAAPGFKIYSSYVLPPYKTKSGTSMATPFVSGIAALYAQANPGVVGKALWDLMTSRVRPLPLPAQDVGSGFIQAP